MTDDSNNNKQKVEVEIKKADAGKNPAESANNESKRKTPAGTVQEERLDLKAKADEVTEGQAEEQASAEKVQEEEAEPQEKYIEQVTAEYEEKIRELEDRYLRLAAEFDNYRKRMARQFEEIIRNSSEKVIIQILEVADNFERALEAASKSSDFKSLHSGTELIYQHLLDILKKEGVEPIEAVGKKFDPNLHEAMMQIESNEHPEGVIVQEMTRGFKLDGRVIRFSKVAVSKGQPEKEEQTE